MKSISLPTRHGIFHLVGVLSKQVITFAKLVLAYTYPIYKENLRMHDIDKKQKPNCKSGLWELFVVDLQITSFAMSHVSACYLPQ